MMRPPSFVLWSGCGKVRSDAATRRYLHHLIRHQKRSEQLCFQSAAVAEQKMRTVNESILDLVFCLQPRDDNLFLLCSHNRRSPVFDHPTSFPLSDSLRLIPREAETPHGRAQRDGFDGEVVGGAHQTRSPKGKTVTHQRILKSCFIHLHHIPSDGRESSIHTKPINACRCPFLVRSSLVHSVQEHGEFVLLSGPFFSGCLCLRFSYPPLILSPSVRDHVD